MLYARGAFVGGVAGAIAGYLLRDTTASATDTSAKLTAAAMTTVPGLLLGVVLGLGIAGALLSIWRRLR